MQGIEFLELQFLELFNECSHLIVTTQICKVYNFLNYNFWNYLMNVLI